MEACRFLVSIEERNEYGDVIRNMLVGRFVAKGDAIAFAKHRFEGDTKGYRYCVRTQNGTHVVSMDHERTVFA